MADLPKWEWGCLLNEGFQNEFQQGYIEINPDAGTPYRRLKFSDIQDIVSGSLSLVDSDYIDFMSWYKCDIKQGTIPFIFYDCRVKKDRIVRLTINKPQFIRYSNRWTIPVTIIFDSGIFYVDKVLVANSEIPLEANGKLITAGVKRYL